MKDNQEDYYSVQDVVKKAKHLFSFLIGKWWILLLALIIGAVAGGFYFSIQKPKYEGVCTFILEEKANGMGSLSSIASQFGFDMGGVGSGGSIFAGDNILDILTSKTVVRKVLLSKIDSAKESQTLADLYLAFTKTKENLKRFPTLRNIQFSEIMTDLNPVEDSVLNIIYQKVTKQHLIADRINKKGTIIRVKVQSENPVFSKLMAERLVQEASSMYLNVKVGTAKANIEQLQRRSDSLLSLLNNRSYTAAATQLLDVNPGIKTASVPVEIVNRDKTVIATLYTEVTKNLEMSKLLLSQQTPVIQILDRPDISMYDNKKGMLFLMAVFSFVTFILSLGLLTVSYFFKNRKPINF